jgi:hypothetical protein
MEMTTSPPVPGTVRRPLPVGVRLLTCRLPDLIKAITARPPIFAPNQKSTYSNIAFELIGLAIANVTGQTYESYIEDAIFKPLGMSKSTLSKPSDIAGVIPLQPHYWDIDEGIQNPTGGIFSSAEDLSKYLRYVLTHYNGITPANNWAHPHSPAEGMFSFYGMPWEIFRTDKILQGSRRPVQFVTKSGGLPGYFSIIMFLPEYDLGITILIASDKPALLDELREAVTVTLVRAAEQLSVHQLETRYAGTYTASRPDLNSSITLEADHRGLVVTRFVSNSTDILSSPLPDFAGAPRDRPWYVQLVPTLLYSDEKKKEGERWRLLIVDERTDKSRGVWDDFCITNIEGAYYAEIPINDVLLWEGEDGTIDTVELAAFRSKLLKEDGAKSRGSTQAQEQLEL